MRGRSTGWIILVIVIAALAIGVNAVNLEYQRGTDSTEPFWAQLLFWQAPEHRTIKIMQGLDLQGGLQVVLEADVPASTPVASEDMDAATQVIRNRIDALGVTEPLLQRSGERRIVLELPGVSDPDVAVSTIREQAFLEFVDAGYVDIPEGTLIRTTIATGTELTPTVPLTSTADITNTETLTESQQVYSTVITGKDLSSVRVTRGQLNEPQVAFTLKTSGASTFAQFTAANNEQTLGGRRYYLCIVLDKIVISCPSVQQPIPDGQGVITLGSKATVEDAQKLAIQLRSGSLPMSLRVVESRAIGPTLGQDSVNKSVIAGIIGIAVVLVFMLIYYRLPGVLADLALLTFAAISLALYKVFPVTLTLPGIAGFLLSTGMAVDANVLIFERMKEELRAGRSLYAAVEAGFERAWTAIRDSNLSTLITCIILFWFGSNFGASMVKGFAVTLFLGVLISMFTAVVVTHTLMHVMMLLFGEKLRNQHWLMGV